jgi:hypothetical protein
VEIEKFSLTLFVKAGHYTDPRTYGQIGSSTFQHPIRVREAHEEKFRLGQNNGRKFQNNG